MEACYSFHDWPWCIKTPLSDSYSSSMNESRGEQIHTHLVDGFGEEEGASLSEWPSKWERTLKYTRMATWQASWLLVQSWWRLAQIDSIVIDFKKLILARWRAIANFGGIIINIYIDVFWHIYKSFGMSKWNGGALVVDRLISGRLEKKGGKANKISQLQVMMKKKRRRRRQIIIIWLIIDQWELWMEKTRWWLEVGCWGGGESITNGDNKDSFY